MHVAGNPAPFVFLDEHQVRQQLVAGAFLVAVAPFGQVEVRADDADDRPGRVAANGKAARQHMHVVAVFVPEAELRLVGLLALRDAVVGAVRGPAVLRVHQALPRRNMRLDLLIAVAEHLLPAGGVDDRVGFEVPVPDAFLRAGKGQPEPFFALAQSHLGPLAFRHVEMRADDAHRTAVPAADRQAACEHRDVMTLLVQQAQFAFVGVPSVLHSVIQRLRRRPVVRVQQLFPGADIGRDFVRSVAEHLLPAR